MPNYTCYKHHLHWLGAHYHHKASGKISASSLQGFLSKCEQSAKNT